MKNFEKYEHQISKLVNENNALTCSIAIVSGIKKPKNCSSDDDCSECLKKCFEWMYSEYKEPILSDDEKEIVKEMCDVIHKLGCNAVYLIKHGDRCENAYIEVNYENNLTGYSDEITTPWFKNDKFKGMEIEKEYKLEELGITCQTQKDS